MKITAIEPGGSYRVESDSGKTYTIRYCGSGDADPEYVSLWECDCPAAAHGKTCKHITEFLRIKPVLDEAEDDAREQVNLDEIERLQTVRYSHRADEEV